MTAIETELKFIIKIPNAEMLAECKGYTESEIVQIYLYDENLTHRVRKRAYSFGNIEYTENTKRRISLTSSVETEHEISADRFIELSKNIEPGARPLLKTRKTFVYKNKKFEIDIYPEWKKTCIMEVELDSENEQVEFPPFIEILRSVIGDRRYSNHAMAHNFPDEEDMP